LALVLREQTKKSSARRQNPDDNLEIMKDYDESTKPRHDSNLGKHGQRTNTQRAEELLAKCKSSRASPPE